MGNVSADGKTLWLSGRYDDVVTQRHIHWRGEEDSSWTPTAWPHRVATSQTLLPGAHGQHALSPVRSTRISTPLGTSVRFTVPSSLPSLSFITAVGLAQFAIAPAF
jgi:hypothetical protein